MVYKRYIKRGGKVFGPYYYESYRDKNGVPRTRQVDPPKNQISSMQKQIIGLIGLLAVLIGVFLVFSFSTNVSEERSSVLTGKTVSDIYSGYSKISKTHLSSPVSDSFESNLLKLSNPEKIGSFITGFATKNKTKDSEENISEEKNESEEIDKEPEGEQDDFENITESENETNDTQSDNQTTNETPEINETEKGKNESVNESMDENESNESAYNESEKNETINETTNTTQSDNETKNVTEPGQECEEGKIRCDDDNEKILVCRDNNWTVYNVCEQGYCDKDEVKCLKGEESGEINETKPENETNDTQSDNQTTNETPEINETESNKTQENQSIYDDIANITTKQHNAIIGKPVKWKKEIEVTESGIESGLVKTQSEISSENDSNRIIRASLPSSSGDISVRKVKNETNETNDVGIQTSGNTREIQEVEPIQYETKESGYVPNRVQNFIRFAGNVINIKEEKEDVVVEINESMEPGDKFEIEYYTTSPYSKEDVVSKNKKNITVIGPDEVHYNNILAFSKLPQEVSNKENVDLRHITIDDEKRKADFELHDYDDDGKYGYISWIVPHLSEQHYELGINILTVQSYPVTQGNWNVDFSTVGKEDLIIRPVDGTYWEEDSNNKDLRFISIKCGGEDVNYEWTGEEAIIRDYECNETSVETSRILSSGKHALKFEFGNATAYAYNDAQDSNIPRTLNLHGKLTNSSGEILNGTHNMTFRIYDSDTEGELLYESNRTITADNEGVYNVVLEDVNVSFENKTYLGIKVGNDSEMTPRIDLTSTPYTERSRTADSLNPSNNYQMKNLSVSSKITFQGGEEIQNTGEGLIKITDSLNVSENITAKHFIGNGSKLTNVATEGDGIYLYLNRSEMNLNKSRLNETIDDRVLQQKYYAGEEYIYLNGSRYFKLNETVLNRTIYDIASQYNDTDYINSQLDNYYNITEIDSEFENYYNKTETQNRFINESEAENLEVNYSEYSNHTGFWNNVSDWVKSWFYEDNDSLAFNESKLNNTIDDRAQVSDTNETARFENLTDGNCPGDDKMVGVDSDGNIICGNDTTIGNCSEDQSCGNLVYTSDDYIGGLNCNDSQIAVYNNDSGNWECSEDTDSVWNITDYIINDSGSLNVNETRLNNTISLLDNDTLAELDCGDEEIAKYNLTSGNWECANDSNEDTLYFAEKKYIWKNDSNYFYLNESMLNDTIDDRVLQQKYYADEGLELNGSRHFKINKTYFTKGDYLWINDSDGIYINETKLNNTINALENDTLYYAYGDYIYNNGSNYFVLNETRLNKTIGDIDNDTLSGLGCSNNQIARYNSTSSEWECSEDINTEKSAGGDYLWNDTDAIYFNETVLNDTINSLDNDTLAELDCGDEEIAKYNLSSGQWECSVDEDEDTLYYAEGDYILKNDSDYFSLNETRLNNTINALENDTLEEMNCNDSQMVQYNETSEEWQCTYMADLKVNSSDYWDDLDDPSDISHSNLGNLQGGGGNEYYHLNQSYYQRVIDNAYKWLIGIWGENNENDLLVSNGTHMGYNQTVLNESINSLDNDTLAELDCGDEEIAKFNLSSGNWECANDTDEDTLYFAEEKYIWKNESNYFYLNESRLNETIDSRAEDIDTIWNLTGYMINDSGSLNVNETKLNNTINSLDNDTLYYANEKYIWKNESNYFYLNETVLNETIDSIDNDTLDELDCSDNEIIRYNVTSGEWECSGDIIEGMGTANYIPLWSDNKTLNDSVIYQNPTTGDIGLGIESPETELGMGKGSISGIDSIEWDVQTVNGARVETWDGASGPSDGDWGSWSTSGTVEVSGDESWVDSYEGDFLHISTGSSATSPNINLDDFSWEGGRIYLDFWASFHGADSYEHKIRFSNDGGGTWKTLDTIKKPNTGGTESLGRWHHLTYDITSLAVHGNNHQIMFDSASPSLPMDNVAIDNVRLVHAPSLGRWVGSDRAGDIAYIGGNVGIGTDNPLNELYVEGDINATGQIYGTIAGEVNSTDYWDDLDDPSDINHSNLGNLQGGGGNEYYHLNQSYYQRVIDNAFNWLVGIWDENNENDLLVSNGTHTGYNQTVLNESINSLDNDTLYYAGGGYIYKNDSNYFFLNETRLNETINSIDNDTLEEMDCNDTQIAKYNATSGEWECSDDINTEKFGGGDYLWNDTDAIYVNESVLNETIDDRILQQKYYAGEEYIYLNGSRYFKLNETRLNMTVYDIAEEVNTEKSAGGDYLWNDTDSIYVNETTLNNTIDSRAGDVDTIWNITGYMINDSGSLNVNETRLNNTINALENDTLYYANEKYIWKNESNYFYLNESRLNDTIKSIDNDTLSSLTCSDEQIPRYNSTSSEWECSEDINTEKSAGGDYLWNDSEAIYFNETVLNETINSLDNDTLAELDCNDSEIAKYNSTSGEWECSVDEDEDTLYYAEGDYILKNDSDYFSLNETRLNNTINALENDTLAELDCLDGQIANYNSTSEEWQCTEEADLKVNSSDYWDDLDDPSDISHNNLSDIQGGSEGERYHLNQSFYDRVIGNAFDWVVGLWDENNANDLLVSNGTNVGYNESVLNDTINSLDNDTLAELDCGDEEIAKFNLSSGNWECANDTDEDTLYFAEEKYIWKNESNYFYLNESRLNETIETISSVQDTNCSETGDCSNLVYMNYTNPGNVTVNSSYDICIEGGNCLSNVVEKAGNVSGSGTQNYIAKWSDNESLTDSSIQDETEEVTVWI